MSSLGGQMSLCSGVGEERSQCEQESLPLGLADIVSTKSPECTRLDGPHLPLLLLSNALQIPMVTLTEGTCVHADTHADLQTPMHTPLE